MQLNSARYYFTSLRDCDTESINHSLSDLAVVTTSYDSAELDKSALYYPDCLHTASALSVKKSHGGRLMIHTRVITLGCVSFLVQKVSIFKKLDTSPHYTIPMVIVIVQLNLQNINRDFINFSFFCKNYIFFLVVLCKSTKENFSNSTKF